MRRQLIGSAALAFAFLAASCSDAGDGSTAAAVTTTVPAEVTTTVEVESTAASQSSESVTNEAASPEELIGAWDFVWEQGVSVWEIGVDTIEITDGLIDKASYTATGTIIEMTDISGEFACPSSQVGEYEWEIVDDELTLTLVSDPCGGRGSSLNGITFARSS